MSTKFYSTLNIFKVNLIVKVMCANIFEKPSNYIPLAYECPSCSVQPRNCPPPLQSCHENLYSFFLFAIYYCTITEVKLLYKFTSFVLIVTNIDYEIY